MTHQRRILRSLPRERGVALIAVTALALVIAVLALGLTRESRLGVQVATAVKAQTEALEAAKSLELWTGLRLAAAQTGAPRALSQSGPVTLASSGALPLDGRSTSGRAFGFSADVRVQAERGKLDLLTAPVTDIRNLLAATGVTDASRIADHVTRVRGNVRSGISWRLDARPINSLGELAQDVGLGWGTLDQLRGIATVHGGLAEPDPVTAPEALYRVLELDDDTRRLTNRRRAGAGSRAVTEGPQTYTLAITVRRGDGVALTRLRRLTVEKDGDLRWHVPLN